MTNPVAPARSTCGGCRHANHGTDDAGEGRLACPWLGATQADSPCRVIFRDGDVFAFEGLSGANGTWRLDTGFREIPIGYEHLNVVLIDDGSDSSGGSLTLEIDDGPGSDASANGRSVFLFEQSDPECFCFSGDGVWWRRLWSGGDLGSGTLTLTPTDIVFVRSTAAQRLSSRGPQPATVDALERAFARQGGIRKPLADVADATMSFEGMGVYGFGRAAVSDVTVTDSEGLTTRFRFLGHDGARALLRVLRPLLDARKRPGHS